MVSIAYELVSSQRCSALGQQSIRSNRSTSDSLVFWIATNCALDSLVIGRGTCCPATRDQMGCCESKEQKVLPHIDEKAIQPSSKLGPGEQVEALIFEGGGTKGTAYAGVVLALEAAGVMGSCKKFAGTSCGSIFTALVAVGYSGKELEAILKETPWDKMLDGGCCLPRELYFGWGRHKGKFLEKYLDKLIAAKMEQLDKEGKLLRPRAACRKNWRRLTLRELQDYRGVDARFGVMEVSQTRWKLLNSSDYPDIPLSVAAHASSSIPFVFRPVPWKATGELFVDGGLLGNMPVNAFAGEAVGAGRTLACNLVGKGQYRLLQGRGNKVKNFKHYAGAVLMSYETLMQDAEGQALTSKAREGIDVIYIDVGDAAMLDTEMSKEDLARMVARGREAAERYLSDMK